MNGYWIAFIVVAFLGAISFMNIDAAWTDDKSRPGKQSGKNSMLWVIGIACVIMVIIFVYKAITIGR